MILEAAYLHIKPGQKENFERDFKVASPLISSIDGYLKHSLKRCLEVENKYLLLAAWEKLEDHLEGFRRSEAYLKWKQLLHHYYDPFPVVAHFEEVSYA